MTRNRLAAVVLTFLLSSLLMAQKQDDESRFVRLMSAQSVRLQEIDGVKYRRAEGPARFLHNDTWLICDTALWNVDERVIYALGHVSIEQENTELTSDKLTYYVDNNTAEFRGGVVQLRDKDGNTLRTHHLDYNTKDSVAVFRDGGAMRDKDGQIIESVTGTYKAKEKTFEFSEKVNMFTDSVFVKTSLLIYESDKSLATYPNYVEAWKDDKMLAGGNGHYDRSNELFFFTDNVHLMSDTQEGWCDSLFFGRKTSNVELLGNTQLADTTRNVSALAGRIYYVDSLSQVTLHRDPVVLMVTSSTGKSGKSVRDSVYFRADDIVYWDVPRCAVSSADTSAAAKRLEALSVDAIANIRAKAAEAAAKAAADAAENDPNRPPVLAGKAAPLSKDGKTDKQGTKKEIGKLSAGKMESKDSLGVSKDSLGIVKDSLNVSKDSLAVKDTVPPVPDSTKIGFLLAKGKVKLFRKAMQLCCDSLRYCDLDSLARLYKDPIVWNEGRHQYTADSIYVVVQNGKMSKADLLSNAFIHVKEGDNFFDQIKSSEMMAYFNDSTQLRRFDAMGSASALFYIKEKEKIATANRKEATILSADFERGEVTKITYFENPKSDAFPVAQMKKTDKFLKGFNWRPELKPNSPADLTSRVPRASQRNYYESRPRCIFVETEVYFQGYMNKIYREIARTDSLRRVNEQRRQQAAKLSKSLDSLKLAASADSLSVKDSLAAKSKDTSAVLAAVPVAKDSASVNSVTVPKDSLAVKDSLGVKDSLALKDTVHIPTKAELREAQRRARQEEFDRKLAERQAEREKKWAVKDKKDAARKAAKAAKKAEYRRKKEAAMVAAYLKRTQKEEARKEKYRQQYIKSHQVNLKKQQSKK